MPVSADRMDLRVALQTSSMPVAQAAASLLVSGAIKVYSSTSITYISEAPRLRGLLASAEAAMVRARSATARQRQELLRDSWQRVLNWWSDFPGLDLIKERMSGDPDVEFLFFRSSISGEVVSGHEYRIHYQQNDERMKEFYGSEWEEPPPPGFGSARPQSR
jgi:hypothetical protein